MYEITGKKYTLSGSGKTATYFEHRYNYVRGFIRKPSDIKDLHELAEEYCDRVVSVYTEIDLNFKGEMKKLRKGVYDDNSARRSNIKAVAKLRRSKRLFNEATRLAEKAEKRNRSGKQLPLYDSKLLATGTIPQFRATTPTDAGGKYTLPSGNQGTYYDLCGGAWQFKITDRDDLKFIIELVRNKNEMDILSSIAAICYYGELAGAYMNGLLNYGIPCDRYIIDSLNEIASRKGDNDIVTKYRSELYLEFSQIDWLHDRPRDQWGVLDD